MKRIKGMIAFVLAIVMMLTGAQNIVWASDSVQFLYNEEQAESVVVDLFEAADQQNWCKFTELMCNSEKGYYKY